MCFIRFISIRSEIEKKNPLIQLYGQLERKSHEYISYLCVFFSLHFHHKIRSVLSSTLLKLIRFVDLSTTRKENALNLYIILMFWFEYQFVLVAVHVEQPPQYRYYKWMTATQIVMAHQLSSISKLKSGADFIVAFRSKSNPIFQHTQEKRKCHLMRPMRAEKKENLSPKSFSRC